MKQKKGKSTVFIMEKEKKISSGNENKEKTSKKISMTTEKEETKVMESKKMNFIGNDKMVSEKMKKAIKDAFLSVELVMAQEVVEEKVCVYYCPSWKNSNGNFVPTSKLCPLPVYGENFWRRFVEIVDPFFKNPVVAEKGELGSFYFAIQNNDSPTTRNKNNIESSRLIGIDIDNLRGNLKKFMEDIDNSGFNYMVFSSFNHLAKEKDYSKRLKLIIPLRHSIDVENYTFAKKQIMSKLGLTLEDLDDASNDKVSQVEYLPTLRNEEARKDYIYKCKTNGDFFEYDVQQAHKFIYMDTPTTKKSKRKHTPRPKNNQSSLKNNSYCSLYSLTAFTFEKEFTISEAMNDILVKQGIYVYEDDNRYKYYASHSEAGAVIYEAENVMHSFHSTTDPIGIYGKNLHAFDACAYSLYAQPRENVAYTDLMIYRSKFEQFLIEKKLINIDMLKKYATEYNILVNEIKNRQVC